MTATGYRETKATPLCHCGGVQVDKCKVCHRPLCEVHAAETTCGNCRAERRTDQQDWGGLGPKVITIGAAVAAALALVVMVPQAIPSGLGMVSTKVLLGLSAVGALAAGAWPAAAVIKRRRLTRRRRKARLLQQHNPDVK